MNQQQKVARLEELLARIQANAAAPRTAAPVAPVMVAHAPPVVASPPPPPVAPVMVAAAEAVVTSSPPIEAPPRAADPITTPPPSDPGGYDEDDVEVSSEVVEVDIDVDEPEMVAATAAESGVNELIEVRDDEDEEEAAPNTQANASHDEELHATPANELEEPSPSSSRRPIAAEETAESFEDESAPRHTPPPESGKQVAPSVAPKISAPPPSLEGHTLIGGWREPGAGGAPNIVTGMNTGVRVPAPAAVISAEAFKPALPATAHVSSIEGTPPAFKPQNFGDLLDATLSL